MSGIFLDIIYLLLSLFYVPAFLLKGRHRLGLRQRCGVFSPEILRQWADGRPVIWLHAVSVGEIHAAEGLIQAIRKRNPGSRLVLSTITPTGNSVAQRLAQQGDSVIYFPFDVSFVVRRVLRQMRPRLIIIMETELWPNLMHEAGRQHIPLVIANGRISDRAYARYRLIAWLLRPALQRISWCCMQSEADRLRIISLGAEPRRITVTGNLKFDQADANVGPLPELGIGKEERLIIAGSTHEPEEELITRVFLKLRVRYPGLRLLLAPRHPHRSQEVAAMVQKHQLSAHLLSSESVPVAGTAPVLILDVMGVLRQAYRKAAIVIIGGSLVKHGGQNPIEAAVWGKPIVFGPYMFNFSGISALFLQQDAAVQTSGAADLERTLAGLLDDRERCRRLGDNARQLVEAQRGSGSEVMKALAPFLGTLA